MLAQLTTAVDELVAADLVGLQDADLHELVVGLERESSRVAAARALVLAEWEARKTWADDGSRSPRTRLARECGIAKETIGKDLHRARKLRHMPATAAAFAEGGLSVDFVQLLVNVNTAPVATQFARDEAMLVGEAAKMRYEEARAFLAYWRMHADAESDANQRDRQTARRHACFDRTFQGGVHLNGWLPALEGTAFLNEARRLERQLFDEDLAKARVEHPEDPHAHLARTPANRRADALLRMAARSAALADDARLPAPLYTVLVGYESASRAICQLEDGTVINPTQLLPYMTEADFERVVFAGASRVIDVGARTRFFTGALRRAIQVRDRHCQHPSGCDEPLDRCEVDHIDEYEDGGPTTQANGELECRYHNRWKHNHKHHNNRPPPEAA
jgi:hypothetical protein